MKSPKPAVFEFKISLKDITPTIWRRFQVKSNITLEELHVVLQIVMGWTDSHLHSFTFSGTQYSWAEEQCELDECNMKDETGIKLYTLIHAPKDSFIYDYDFGDDWKHNVLLERVLPVERGVYYPRCLDGKRACPPEDCGGSGGYDEIMNAIKNPENPEYKEIYDWISDDTGKVLYEPEKFDVETINKILCGEINWVTLLKSMHE